MAFGWRPSPRQSLAPPRFRPSLRRPRSRRGAPVAQVRHEASIGSSSARFPAAGPPARGSPRLQTRFGELLRHDPLAAYTLRCAQRQAAVFAANRDGHRAVARAVSGTRDVRRRFFVDARGVRPGGGSRPGEDGRSKRREPGRFACGGPGFPAVGLDARRRLEGPGGGGGARGRRRGGAGSGRGGAGRRGSRADGGAGLGRASRATAAGLRDGTLLRSALLRARVRGSPRSRRVLSLPAPPRHLVDLASCPRVPVERSIFDPL